MSVELRRDYLINRYVVFAPSRSRRPSDFKVVAATEHGSEKCPFCAGKEEQTPPATYLLTREGGQLRVSSDGPNERKRGWLVRVVPNLYPAFSVQEGSLTPAPPGVEPTRLAYGYHEVLIESPVHDQHFWIAPEEQRQLVIRAILDRVEAFSKDNRIKSILPFRNHGREAGASLSHAHTQIVASEHVPAVIAAEDEAFCDGKSLVTIAEEESKSQRAIYENASFYAFASWAGITPYSFVIVPKKPGPTPLGTDIPSLSDVLSKTLRALASVLNDPPFNLAWHMAPLPWDAHRSFQWHIEVYPKLSIWAGYEIGGGTYINVVTPEQAATYLRAAIK
ncbi:MAG: galactose-1-phosphate uridylyltransferase [Thermoprotei archaeon]